MLAGTVHATEKAPEASLVVDAIVVPVPDEDSVMVCDGLKPLPVKVTVLPATTTDGDAVNVGVVWACAKPPMRRREENTATVIVATRTAIRCRVTP